MPSSQIREFSSAIHILISIRENAASFFLFRFRVDLGRFWIVFPRCLKCVLLVQLSETDKNSSKLFKILNKPRFRTFRQQLWGTSSAGDAMDTRKLIFPTKPPTVNSESRLTQFPSEARGEIITVIKTESDFDLYRNW